MTTITWMPAGIRRFLSDAADDIRRAFTKLTDIEEPPAPARSPSILKAMQTSRKPRAESVPGCA